MEKSQFGDSFLGRLNSDGNSAASELDQRYRTKLCQLVEREMNHRFQRREDPEDVVQSAFRTFYRRNAIGEFSIDSSGNLWRLLETITRHKMLKHIEKLNAGKRDPQREEYPEGDGLQGHIPTPEEAVIATDLIGTVLSGLDEIYADILLMRLQKYTEEEIALQLNYTRSFIRSKLSRLRERLQRLSDDNTES